MCNSFCRLIESVLGCLAWVELLCVPLLALIRGDSFLDRAACGLAWRVPNDSCIARAIWREDAPLGRSWGLCACEVCRYRSLVGLLISSSHPAIAM